MNGSTMKGTLILTVIVALAGGAFAAEDPDEVRVVLKIVAADS